MSIKRSTPRSHFCRWVHFSPHHHSPGDVNLWCRDNVKLDNLCVVAWRVCDEMCECMCGVNKIGPHCTRCNTEVSHAVSHSSLDSTTLPLMHHLCICHPQIVYFKQYSYFMAGCGSHKPTNCKMNVFFVFVSLHFHASVQHRRAYDTENDFISHCLTPKPCWIISWKDYYQSCASILNHIWHLWQKYEPRYYSTTTTTTATSSTIAVSTL